MGKKILIAFEAASAVLFVMHYQLNPGQHFLSWFVPLVVVLMIAINSVWFTRFLSWVIFSVSFFCLLVLLSAFTIRWRFEPGFLSGPFYRAMLMNVVFVYVSLAQIKLIGGAMNQLGSEK